MAQNTNAANCIELAENLCLVLNRDADSQRVQRTIDQLVNSTRILSLEDASAVLRLIFYPYGSRTLTYKNQRLAIKMVKLMEWWLGAKPESGKIDPLMNLICEQQVLMVEKPPNNKIHLR
ncbi:unnamed protein product [Adineta steineri]|uniref:Uncharacterized protein n=1 Tax=Adineta steineri TaxID=433720 RepID=A0A814ET93_9BILA|nr:unnamed protein product [Adineta steineri]CAF3743457.1 unnamed protein product [Adineta steineri]